LYRGFVIVCTVSKLAFGIQPLRDAQCSAFHKPTCQRQLQVWVMGGVTTVAKGHQVGQFIRAAEVTGHQVMNVRFTATTCDTTGNALMIVAVQDDGANLLPTKLLRLRSVRDGYRSTADRTRDGKTNTVSIHHQMLAAVWTVEGDVNHGCRIANRENGQ
jgi:hypothetical protein